eukprot:Nk52_evm78s1444 gene=Nk52_evmTU78s1444
MGPFQLHSLHDWSSPPQSACEECDASAVPVTVHCAATAYLTANGKICYSTPLQSTTTTWNDVVMRDAENMALMPWFACVAALCGLVILLMRTFEYLPFRKRLENVDHKTANLKTDEGLKMARLKQQLMMFSLSRKYWQTKPDKTEHMV